MKKNKILAKILTRKIIFLVLFMFAFVCGWNCQKNITNDKNPDIYELRASGYDYISPLLECEYKNIDNCECLKNLKNSINKYISLEINKKNLGEVSVYFRDLKTGKYFIINKNAKFSPASLLKIPLMLTYYKLAEESDILNKEIIYQGEFDNCNGEICAEYLNVDSVDKTIAKNSIYKIEDLIYKMIVYSDNKSKDLLKKYLIENIDLNILEKTERELKYFMPFLSNAQNIQISTEEYAIVFRILYNASYLNKKMSEKALDLLTESEYNYGLKAGTPIKIEVANKFGIKNDNEKELRQIHDCGLVYHPHKPYLLCIMTKIKNSHNNPHSIIEDLSRITYNNLSQQ